MSVLSHYPPLRFEGDRAQDVEAPNGPSAERNPESTQRELDKEIATGNIIRPPPPLRVSGSPRGASSRRQPRTDPSRWAICPLANRSTMESLRRATWRWPAYGTSKDAYSNATCALVNAGWQRRTQKPHTARSRLRHEDWQLQGIKRTASTTSTPE